MLGLVSQMGIAGGGEDGVMAEELLHLNQIDARFDQVGRIAMAIIPISELAPLFRVPDYSELHVVVGAASVEFQWLVPRSSA